MKYNNKLLLEVSVSYICSVVSNKLSKETFTVLYDETNSPINRRLYKLLENMHGHLINNYVYTP